MTKLNVLFKKMQKDDKKEVLEFHVQGNELADSEKLVSMSGSIAVLNVAESKAGEFNAEFVSIQKDSKKTTLKFNIKGDSQDKVIKLYPFAGRGVTLDLTPSQMSIDEFYDNDHEGIEYKVDKDGTASVSPDQMSLDDSEIQDEAQVQVEPEHREEHPKDAFSDETNEDPFSDDDLLD